MNRSIKYLLVFLTFSSVLSAASVRSQVSLLEASENIRLKSQQIAVNYLAYYANPKKYFSEKEIALQRLQGLDREFELVDRSTKEEESEQILSALKQSRSKMQELLKSPLSTENLESVLHYSDMMLNATESINHMLDFELLSEEAKIVVNMKHVSFVIEKMIKFYMVTHIEKSNKEYVELFEKSISEMEESLTELNDYNYNSRNFSVLTELVKSWKVLKTYYTKDVNLMLENIVLLASREVQRYSILLEKYHSKDQ